MGDRRNRALRVQFDGKRKLEFHRTKITSDAGLLAFRELDEAFRLTEKRSAVLSDCRRGKNTQHTMPAMLRRGNHASDKFWRPVLLPVIERYQDRDIPKSFRGDAATEREIGDSLGRRLALRRDPAEPWFRRREWPDRRLRVPGRRFTGQEHRQHGWCSLGSGGSPG